MRVLALADRPHTNSFGMVPIIVDVGLLEDFICLGLAPASWQRSMVSKKEFSTLLNSGHVTDISYLNLVVEANLKKPNLFATGWLGDIFFEESIAIGIPVSDIPQNSHFIKEWGRFWFEDSKVLYKRLKNWVQLAATRVFREKNVKLVELMQWTLPSAPETLAAFWYVKEKEAEKDKEIEWQLGTFFKGKNRKTLVAEHNRLIRRYL